MFRNQSNLQRIWAANDWTFVGPLLANDPSANGTAMRIYLTVAQRGVAFSQYLADVGPTIFLQRIWAANGWTSEGSLLVNGPLANGTGMRTFLTVAQRRTTISQYLADVGPAIFCYLSCYFEARIMVEDADVLVSLQQRQSCQRAVCAVGEIDSLLQWLCSKLLQTC